MQSSESSFHPLASVDSLRLKTYLHYAALAPFTIRRAAHSQRQTSQVHKRRRIGGTSHDGREDKRLAKGRTLDVPDIVPRRAKKYLRGMEKLQKKYLNSCIRTYYQHLEDKRIPSQSNKNRCSSLTIPASGFMPLPPPTPMHGSIYNVSSSSDISRLIYETALKTAVTLLHHIDSATKGWHFTRSELMSSGNADVFVLESAEENVDMDGEGSKPITKAKFLVITLPPWEFTDDDLMEFVNLTRLRDDVQNFCQDRILSRKPSKAEKLWLTVHDYCFQHSCHYWSIATYDRWIYGAFSERYSYGWTTNVLTKDKQSPSVLQYLVYWMHSAFGSSGTWLIPEVRDELVLNYIDSLDTSSALTSELSSGMNTNANAIAGPSRKRKMKTPSTYSSVSSDEFSDSDCGGDYERDEPQEILDPRKHTFVYPNKRKRPRTASSDSYPVISESSGSSKTVVTDEVEGHGCGWDDGALKMDIGFAKHISKALDGPRAELATEFERDGADDDLGPCDSISQVKWEGVTGSVYHNELRLQWPLQSLWSKMASGLACAAENTFRVFRLSSRTVSDGTVYGMVDAPGTTQTPVGSNNTDEELSDAASSSSDDDDSP